MINLLKLLYNLINNVINIILNIIYTTYSIFDTIYLNIIQVKQMISLLPLNNFYPVISYRRVQKERDELSYTSSVTRYGPRKRLKWHPSHFKV